MTLKKTGRSYELVSAQDHGSLEGRPLVRENTLDGFRGDRDFAPMESPLAQQAALQKRPDGEHKVEQDLLKSLWKERPYSEGYQWGWSST